MRIGRRIKELRREKELKQVELASKAGISNTYLSDIESDRTMPSLKTLIKISNALGVNTNIFLTNNYVKIEHYNPSNNLITKQNRSA